MAKNFKSHQIDPEEETEDDYDIDVNAFVITMTISAHKSRNNGGEGELYMPALIDLGKLFFDKAHILKFLHDWPYEFKTSGGTHDKYGRVNRPYQYIEGEIDWAPEYGEKLGQIHLQAVMRLKSYGRPKFNTFRNSDLYIWLNSVWSALCQAHKLEPPPGSLNFDVHLNSDKNFMSKRYVRKTKFDQKFNASMEAIEESPPSETAHE